MVIRHTKAGLEFILSKMILPRLEKKVEHHNIHHNLQSYLDKGYKIIPNEKEKRPNYLILRQGYDTVIYDTVHNIADEYLISEIIKNNNGQKRK